jgi:hypothetical protein
LHSLQKFLEKADASLVWKNAKPLRGLVQEAIQEASREVVNDSPFVFR